MDWQVACAFGMLGGVFAELLGFYRLKHEAPNNLPQWVRSPFYWCVTAAMIFAGGGLASVYVASEISLTPLLAVNIGASAPLIIGSIVAQAPQVGKID